MNALWVISVSHASTWLLRGLGHHPTLQAQFRSVEMLPAQREARSMQSGSGTKGAVSFSPGSLRYAARAQGLDRIE